MAKREVLGLMPCPDCGHDSAEIKRQKCGVKLYRHCPECNAQFFARSDQQGRAMLARIAPPPPSVTVTDKPPPEAAQAPAIVPAPDKAPPVTAPKKTAPKKPAPMADALAFMMGRK